MSFKKERDVYAYIYLDMSIFLSSQWSMEWSSIELPIIKRDFVCRYYNDHQNSSHSKPHCHNDFPSFPTLQLLASAFVWHGEMGILLGVIVRWIDQASKQAAICIITFGFRRDLLVSCHSISLSLPPTPFAPCLPWFSKYLPHMCLSACRSALLEQSWGSHNCIICN